MCRNFDWQDCQCIISEVKPKGGYRYVSAFNPDFFGFGMDRKPELMLRLIQDFGAEPLPHNADGGGGGVYTVGGIPGIVP